MDTHAAVLVPFLNSDLTVLDSFNAAIPSVTLFSGKLSLHTVNEKALLPLLTFQLYSVISMCPCSTALSNNLDAVVAVSTSVTFIVLVVMFTAVIITMVLLCARKKYNRASQYFVSKTVLSLLSIIY